tara:strand:+ start:3185 stop:3322 length:138 start_codon:yes stop_codon:yes gene_type:complete
MNQREREIKSKMLNYMVEQELKIDKLEKVIKSFNDVDKCLEHLNN